MGHGEGLATCGSEARHLWPRAPRSAVLGAGPLSPGHFREGRARGSSKKAETQSQPPLEMSPLTFSRHNTGYRAQRVSPDPNPRSKLTKKSTETASRNLLLPIERFPSSPGPTRNTSDECLARVPERAEDSGGCCWSRPPVQALLILRAPDTCCTATSKAMKTTQLPGLCPAYLTRFIKGHLQYIPNTSL